MALEDVYARNLEHRTHRAGWLRAAVLGANDGLVSTAALLIGVAAARADSFLVTAGLAGISAGAMSMAVGRDELGQHPHSKARPLQAAIASAASFTVGGVIPFLGAFAPTPGAKAWSIIAFTIVGLIFTGILSARIAGSTIFKPTIRVLLGGCAGMAITAGIGQLAHISGI